MAEELKKGFNADLVGEDLERCCRGEELCGHCQGLACNIGFAKKCIRDFKISPAKEVPGGVRRIPTTDFKLFDELELERAIAHILRECKDCKEEHTENCIINVVRNCYEVSLLGDRHPYEGSTVQYLVYLKDHYPDKAREIADQYMSMSKKAEGAL